MIIVLKYCGINLKLNIERDVKVERMLTPFLVEEENANGLTSNINITVTWNYDNAMHPKSIVAGKDMIQTYYKEDKLNFCVVQEGDKGPISITEYTSDFSYIKCTINEAPFQNPPNSVSRILQLLPMRAIFQYFGVIFLHSSQIAIDGKGILFSGNSGCGKTTQAKLWKYYQKDKIDIICNDRTLIRKNTLNEWITYGYPFDGSEPVRSDKENKLSCIVLPIHALENRIVRLSISKAITALMSQMVIDTWSGEAREIAMNLLLDMLKEIPVYQLYCTADERAVNCLEQQLRKDGVIG